MLNGTKDRTSAKWGNTTPFVKLSNYCKLEATLGKRRESVPMENSLRASQGNPKNSQKRRILHIKAGILAKSSKGKVARRNFICIARREGSDDSLNEFLKGVTFRFYSRFFLMFRIFFFEVSFDMRQSFRNLRSFIYFKRAL